LGLLAVAFNRRLAEAASCSDWSSQVASSQLNSAKAFRRFILQEVQAERFWFLLIAGLLRLHCYNEIILSAEGKASCFSLLRRRNLVSSQKLY
jgi:hypothetical protein